MPAVSIAERTELDGRALGGRALGLNSKLVIHEFDQWSGSDERMPAATSDGWGFIISGCGICWADVAPSPEG
jgi:hypothetical protein